MKIDLSLAATMVASIVVFSVLPLRSYAGPMQLVMGDPMQTVIDDMAGDNDLATAGKIKFSLMGAGWKASGTVLENIVDTKSAVLTLTDFMIERIAGGPVGGIVVPLAVQTRMFGAIPPPSTASASLVGNFVDAGTTGNVAVDMFANASGQPIGGNLIANAPPNDFSKSAGPVISNGPVTMLDILLTFSLTDVGDKVVLPNSASAFDVPEPSTWFLLGTGLIGLLGYGWRRRRQEHPSGVHRA